MLDRRRRTTTLALCTIFLLLLGTGSSLAEGEEMPEMSAEAKAEMNAWMKLAQPGEHHEHLGRFAGKWNSTNKMWMQPGAEPMLTTTKAEAEWKDRDHFTYVAYMDYGGGEAKHMEMQYERASD